MARRPKTAPETDASPDKRVAPVRPQMADIARLAGVSVSAVSRALRGSPEIGEETRKRIVELARSLNYTVNLSAANLRLKQNTTVAIVMPYAEKPRAQLTDPFFISLIASIADALSDRGYETLLTRLDKSQGNFADAYFTGRAVGLIYTGQWLDHDELNKLAIASVPFAVWGEQQDQQMYCTVGTDNIHGGRIATEHLFAHGARRVLIVGDFASHELRNRHAGYLLAHERAGIEADPDLFVSSKFETAIVERDMEAVIARGIEFDAVFACSDLTAMTVIDVLMRHGKQVPEDVQVVGYDDIALARYARPSLSTIRQSIEQAGVALVDAIAEQLAGSKPVSRKLETALVQRDSTRH